MKQRARPLHRLLSLLLAFVLALSLLPSAVLADDDVDSGHNSGTGWHGTGDAAPGWAIYNRNKWIARMTLIFVPDGVENWNSETGYQVIGQFDTSSDYSADNLGDIYQWFDTNALSYVSEQESGSSWYRLIGDAKVTSGYTNGANAHGFVNWSQVHSEAASSTAEQLPKVLTDDVTGENPLLGFFTDEVAGKDGEASHQPNKRFTDVLDYMNKQSEYTVTLNMFLNGEGVAGRSGDYRLIVETAVKAPINGKESVVTLRDMMAYDKNSGNSDPYTFKHSWWRSSEWPAYGLYLSRDEFTGWDSAGNEVVIGTPAFKSIPSAEFSKSVQTTKTATDFWAAGPASGYGIAVFNPGKDSSQYNSYVGRVNLYVPTSTTLTGGADSIGATVYSYTGQKGDISNRLQAKAEAAALLKYNGAREVSVGSAIETIAEAEVVGTTAAQHPEAMSNYTSSRVKAIGANADVYGSTEDAVRNLLFSAGLTAGDPQFEAIANSLGLSDGVTKQVITPAQSLQSGLEWGYVGEVVVNYNMYKATSPSSPVTPIKQSLNAPFDFTAQALYTT